MVVSRLGVPEVTPAARVELSWWQYLTVMAASWGACETTLNSSCVLQSNFVQNAVKISHKMCLVFGCKFENRSSGGLMLL